MWHPRRYSRGRGTACPGGHGRMRRRVRRFSLPGCQESNCRSGCGYRRPQRCAEPEGEITRNAVAREGATEQAATFRAVFAVGEFRALWAAQLLSVIGDQLARVALTVLVYDRTRSALLAAITFVASIVPTFIGGVTLAWLADRYPRRAVMIACDLVRCALVLIMAIPGVPLGGLVTLLFLVTLVGAPFSSARAAIYPDVLTGERYVTGTAVTLTTYQFAQVLGFAAGGVVVGFLGTHVSLIVDAATFAGSALIVRARVRTMSAEPAKVAASTIRDTCVPRKPTTTPPAAKPRTCANW